MALARTICAAAAIMPREELFGLTGQMRRAACSIPMNVAESYGNRTRPEHVKGLRMAIGSRNEPSTAQEIAIGLKMNPIGQELLALLAGEDRTIQSLLMKPEAGTGEQAGLAKRQARS